jgi:aspartate/methionine/tyrosine aminotransferase
VSGARGTFSSRFGWEFKPNRLTQALSEMRASGSRILDLTESNPTRAGLQYPAEIAKAFNDPRLLRYDPAPAGSSEAREAVSAYYRSRGERIDPKRILLTASTSEGYCYLFKLLCDPGDDVLVPRPSYPLFEYLAAMESIQTRQYSLAYHGGWWIDMENVAASITPRTRAILLVNPNNPTGSYVKSGELMALTRLCAERGIALISDEVFSDYGFGAAADRIATLANVEQCLAFSMSGLSKVAGLPQMKLGWIVVAGPHAERAQAFERLEWIADTYLSVSTPVQCAAKRLLSSGELVQQQIRSRCAANFGYLREALAGSSAHLLELEGGWYATVQVPRIRAEEEWALELLSAHGVLTQPGYFYDFESEAYLILSLLTEPEVFHEGVQRFRTML